MLRKGLETIAYVGPFSFPDGGAAAQRILGNARTMVAAGYQVVIGSGQQSESHEIVRVDPDIFCASVGERDSEQLPRFIRRARYSVMGRKTRAWLSNLSVKPAAVVLYSGYSPYLFNLVGWCRSNRIPMIFDAVEWYQPNSYLHGLISPYQWNIELAMRVLIPRVDGIFAISTYLQNYYERKDCDVIRIPPTLDTSKVMSRTEGCADPERLVLAYTGMPGENKDRLDLIIEALLQSDPEGRKVVLKIAGIEREDVMRFASIRDRGLRRLPPVIEVVGAVTQSRAMDLVRTADFTINLRVRSRVSEAGFSTKAVESFAVGTPIISNLTGDLARYLVDYKTGIVCDTPTVVETTAAIRKAISLGQVERDAMRAECRLVAENQFDFRKYTSLLGSFLAGLKERVAQ